MSARFYGVFEACKSGRFRCAPVCKFQPDTGATFRAFDRYAAVVFTAWTVWRLAADRYSFELHEALTPRGCALEFELHSGEGCAPSYGIWRWSETGALLLIVMASDC